MISACFSPLRAISSLKPSETHRRPGARSLSGPSPCGHGAAVRHLRRRQGRPRPPAPGDRGFRAPGALRPAPALGPCSARRAAEAAAKALSAAGLAAAELSDSLWGAESEDEQWLLRLPALQRGRELEGLLGKGGLGASAASEKTAKNTEKQGSYVVFGAKNAIKCHKFKAFQGLSKL